MDVRGEARLPKELAEVEVTAQGQSMLLQVCIDDSADWQADILDCTRASFLGKLVSGLNQAHFAPREATRLFCVAHRAVIVQHKYADLVALGVADYVTNLLNFFVDDLCSRR